MNSNNVGNLYDSILYFSNFLKTEVKVKSEMIEEPQKTGSKLGVIINPGCILQVVISNTAPLEPSYPMIVFIGVGLMIEFPKSMPKSIKKMKDEFNFEVDLTDAPQNGPFEFKQMDRVDKIKFEPITPEEQNQGYVLFPRRAIKYKFRLTYKECPDFKQIKLFSEGTISARHLFHYVKETSISESDIVSQL